MARSLLRADRRAREATQRELLVGGMIRAAAEKGYEAARVADVVELSGLSRSTFYRHFEDKEACFLASYGAAVEAILERVEAAMASEATPTRRAEAAVRALVGLLAAEQAIARLVTIEVRSMGAAGQLRYEQAQSRFVALVAGATPGGDVEMARLVVGGVASTIARETAAGRAGQLEALVPELVFTVLAPCAGVERAAAEMERAASEAGVE